MAVASYLKEDMWGSPCNFNADAQTNKQHTRANGSHHYLECKAFPTLTHGQAHPPYRIVEDNYQGYMGDDYGVMCHNHSHCGRLRCGAMAHEAARIPHWMQLNLHTADTHRNCFTVESVTLANTWPYGNGNTIVQT